MGRKESFDNVKTWFDRAKQLGGEDIEAILIGNKNDLDESTREVSIEEGQELAHQLNIPFLETSALSGDHVEQAFVVMTKHIKQRIDKQGKKGIEMSKLQNASTVTFAK